MLARIKDPSYPRLTAIQWKLSLEVTGRQCRASSQTAGPRPELGILVTTHTVFHI